MTKKKILITGGCGYIGAGLIRKLLEKDICKMFRFDDLWR